MSYNKYNTRNSGGRYINKGQFVSAGVLAGAPTQQPAGYSRAFPYQSSNSSNNDQLMPPPPAPQKLQNVLTLQTNDVVMVQEENKRPTPASEPTDPGEEARPSWMKVRKISNKERRRRQNEHLRRLLTPKNAVMVLNEMLPKDQTGSNMKMKSMQLPLYFKQNTSSQQGYSIDLVIDSVVYKGFGESKMSARNSAAEQALRDIMLQKMAKLHSLEASRSEPDASAGDVTVPMIQLASYALHKLFAEWESAGYKVPQLRPPAATSETECGGSEAGDEAMAGSETSSEAGGKRSKSSGPKPKKSKTLPANAHAMHPCMLMTYMRPALEYRDVAADGDRPQTMLFTVALDVDGATYLGKASNKREARKAAARAACFALFDVEFEPTASETAPAF